MVDQGQTIKEVIGWSIYVIMGVLMFMTMVWPYAGDVGEIRWDGLVAWIVGGFFVFILTGWCIYED